MKKDIKKLKQVIKDTQGNEAMEEEIKVIKDMDISDLIEMIKDNRDDDVLLQLIQKLILDHSPRFKQRYDNAFSILKDD